jgi:hypothetical protein
MNDPAFGGQGCQMFLGTTYQYGEKYTKWPQLAPKGHKIYHLAVKYVDKMAIKMPTS